MTPLHTPHLCQGQRLPLLRLHGGGGPAAPCSLPSPLPLRVAGLGRGEMHCSAAGGPVRVRVWHMSLPSGGERIPCNHLSQFLRLWRVVRSNFLLGPSELLTQPLNLIITMIKIITSSLQCLSHHNTARPLLAGSPSMPPFRGPKAPAPHLPSPSTTVGRGDSKTRSCPCASNNAQQGSHGGKS